MMNSEDNNQGGAVGRGTLYLLPVALSDAPIADVLPARAMEVARRATCFVVENLRTARRMLKRIDRTIDIDRLTFTVLDEHTPPAEVGAMTEPLTRGEDVVVMSEAGCPAVADPGSLLVAEAQRRGFRVDPLVGPSSILLSLMGSGFNGQSFAFNGYLPVEAAPRAARIRELERRALRERQTQIFIETPYRNNRLLTELSRTLMPDTLLCVAVDLTSPQQQITTLTAREWSRREYNYDKRPAIFLIHHD